MTPVEIKNEIHKTINELPEDSLYDVLGLLKELQKHPSEKDILDSQLKKIIAENRTLLQKLAQ
jgi:hypothetical protein